MIDPSNYLAGCLSGFSRHVGYVSGLAGFWLQIICHQLAGCSACVLCTRGRCCVRSLCEAHACSKGSVWRKAAQLHSPFCDSRPSPPLIPILSLSFYSPHLSFICLYPFNPSPSVQTQFLSHTLHFLGYIQRSVQGYRKYSFSTSYPTSYIKHQFFLFQDILGVVLCCLQCKNML